MGARCVSRRSRGSLGDQRAAWHTERVTGTVAADASAATPSDPLTAGGQATGWLDPPRLLLVAAVAIWAGVLVHLGDLRQDRFATFGFDLGIYDQAIWLISHGRDPFITVRGLETFGHHVNPVFFLVAPFYRLGAGPHFLLILQVAAQASGAGAVFLLARDRLHDRWLALALGGVYLFHPTSQWLVWEFFHPDALAIGPLLFAYWAARERRWNWFALSAVLAAMCKEDVALVLLVVGLLIAWRGDRKIGLGVSVLSLAWYVVATRVIIPWQNGIGPFYDTFFGTLGSNPVEVAYNIVRHPVGTWRLVSHPDRRSYLWQMLAPVAFVPVLSPSSFAIALPILVVNLVSAFPYTRDAHFHYSSILLVGAIVATVEAVARVPTIEARRVIVVLVLGTSLVTTVKWGPLPISHEYHQGWWPLQVGAQLAAEQHAVALVPGDAAVSATYSFVPHLTHRQRIYEFPVPWRNINWGVDGEHLDDPSRVQWLAIDRDHLDAEGNTVLDGLLRSQFRVVFQQDRIVVARRVHAPPGA